MSSDDKRQRLLRKLAKLKSLAECPTGNPNEAAAAAASMQRLMLEYQIEMAELEGLADASTIEIVRVPLRPGAAPKCAPNWMRHLFSGLSEANQCVGILFREAYGSPKVSLWLLGTEADIENVRTIFDWVTLEVQRLADEWKAVRWWAEVAEANSFKSGAAAGVCDRVRHERAAVVNENPHAMVWLGQKQEAVDAEAAKLNMRVSNVHPQARDHESYLAGYRRGAQMNLNRPQGALT